MKFHKLKKPKQTIKRSNNGKIIIKTRNRGKSPNLKRPKLNVYETRLLRLLLKASGIRLLTTREISLRTGISYNATAKYLRILYDKRMCSSRREPTRIYWWIE